MKPALQFFLIQYLTYSTLLHTSHSFALVGTKVRDASPREFPSVVSIGRKKLCKTSIENVQYCTGTLITDLHVLTAAHCLYRLDKDDAEVIAGDANLYHGVHYDIEDWITFDEWQFGSQAEVVEYPYSDLAIVTLKKPVRNAEPATVLKFIAQDLYDSRVRIAGWGSSEDGTAAAVLKTAVVHVLSNDECDRQLESITNEASHTSEDYFCSRAQPYVLSSCGDSGAPLFNKQNQLVGINVGACPPAGQLCHYPKQWVCQNQVNLHLHLHNYRHFVLCIALNHEEQCRLARRIKNKGF